MNLPIRICKASPPRWKRGLPRLSRFARDFSSRLSREFNRFWNCTLAPIPSSFHVLQRESLMSVCLGIYSPLLPTRVPTSRVSIGGGGRRWNENFKQNDQNFGNFRSRVDWFGSFLIRESSICKKEKKNVSNLILINNKLSRWNEFFRIESKDSDNF